jgi:3-dehydroquinate synthase
MSATLKVDLGARAYPIHIGAGLLDDVALLPGLVRSNQVVVITNEVVAPLYLHRLTRHFGERQCHVYELPDGEGAKSFDNFERVLGFMIERRIERGATIVALGGGVVGDLAGFVAACYQRGIAFVQVPTTLLAQVDSSVGGKTAINHALGKNMVGAFHQPLAVVADVAGDEFETGARATLNLGHTFGHAIETALGYGAWLHGEAVAAGTCLAASMSARLGWLDGGEVARIETLLRRAGLPLRPPSGMTPSQFMDVMARDKKNVGGHIRLVLLQALGAAVVTRDYPPEALAATLAAATTPA